MNVGNVGILNGAQLLLLEVCASPQHLSFILHLRVRFAMFVRHDSHCSILPTLMFTRDRDSLYNRR